MSPLLPKFSLAPLSLYLVSLFVFNSSRVPSLSFFFFFFRAHSSGSHDSRSFCCLRSEPVSFFCKFKLSVLICMRKKGRFFVRAELERADGTAFCLLPSVLPFSLLVLFLAGPLSGESFCRFLIITFGSSPQRSHVARLSPLRMHFRNPNEGTTPPPTQAKKKQAPKSEKKASPASLAN